MYRRAITPQERNYVRDAHVRRGKVQKDGTIDLDDAASREIVFAVSGRTPSRANPDLVTMDQQQSNPFSQGLDMDASESMDVDEVESSHHASDNSDHEDSHSDEDDVYLAQRNIPVDPLDGDDRVFTLDPSTSVDFSRLASAPSKKERSYVTQAHVPDAVRALTGDDGLGFFNCTVDEEERRGLSNGLRSARIEFLRYPRAPVIPPWLWDTIQTAMEKIDPKGYKARVSQLKAADSRDQKTTNDFLPYVCLLTEVWSRLIEVLDPLDSSIKSARTIMHEYNMKSEQIRKDSAAERSTNAGLVQHELSIDDGRAQDQLLALNHALEKIFAEHSLVNTTLNTVMPLFASTLRALTMDTCAVPTYHRQRRLMEAVAPHVVPGMSKPLPTGRQELPPVGSTAPKPPKKDEYAPQLLTGASFRAATEAKDATAVASIVKESEAYVKTLAQIHKTASHSSSQLFRPAPSASGAVGGKKEPKFRSASAPPRFVLKCN